MKLELAVAFLMSISAVSGAKSPACEVKWIKTVDFPVWKGERTHAIALINTSAALSGVTLGVRGCPDANAEFIFDVMGDVFAERFDQSGPRKPGEYDSLLVADRIGPEKSVGIAAGESRPVWVSIRVPADAKAGTHTLTLEIKGKGMATARLPLSYEVADEKLPEPSQWRFHLNLWQNPYAVARYHGVQLWSKEHFEIMKPLYTTLSNAGQKAVTATVIDRPWNGQTQDPFGSMVKKTLNPDGSWSYDYTDFDKWVEFMFSLGIDREIDCFTLLPWKLQFDYADGVSGEAKVTEGAPGTGNYDNYWKAFIKDFAAHLKSKGWFDRTFLAMDERAAETVKACINVIREVEPGFKFSLAGKKYQEQIQDEVADLCIEIIKQIPDSVILARRAKGYQSTFYTCCSERYPNVFLISAPEEAAWIPWYAMAHNLDGYHRWAYNSWTKDPMNDARFRRWPAGDCYIMYPEGSSVRFEQLVEGIQDYEKAVILRQRWKAAGDTARLKALNEALKLFNMTEIGTEGPHKALEAARNVISGR